MMSFLGVTPLSGRGVPTQRGCSGWTKAQDSISSIQCQNSLQPLVSIAQMELATDPTLAQQVYGQSFMCMTMPASELDKVAEMANDEEVWVYDYMVPVGLQPVYPAAVALTADPCSTSAPHLGPAVIHWGTPLTSLGGQHGIGFAKSSSMIPLLLYEQVVEPFMQSGMLWETWQHGPGALPQYCPSPFQCPFSFTVAAVAVPDAAGWYVNRDHSKWGVTSNHTPDCCQSQGTSGSLNLAGQTTVCFGDLNRQKHQSYRGGSAICFLSNRPLWAAWSDLIQKVQDCSSDVQPSTARSHSALQTAGNHSMAEADGDTASMTGQRSAKLL
ncbi:TPA: deoxyribonuclease II activity, variant 3 [Trebouxia sp. C0006]